MKRIKYLITVITAIIVTSFTTSCVQDDNFKTPEIIIAEPNVVANYTIKEIRDLITANNGNPVEIGANSTEPIYIEGYIISSDEEGNIYQKFYIQDAAKNPEYGIVFSTFASNIYPIFSFGRKVYVRVDGLFAANSKGMPSIGAAADTQYGVTRIDDNDFIERVLPSPTIEEILPTPLSIEDVKNDKYLSTYVQLENVQFENPEGNYTEDNKSTNQTITNCDNTQAIITRISSYAKFAGNPKPNGNGKINVIMGKYGSDYQVNINSTTDISFTNERCIPKFLDCEGSSGGSDVIFEQDFSTSNNLANIGWENINVKGNVNFEIKSHAGEKYVQISGHRTTQSYETWLLTPAINFDNHNSEEFTFDLQVNYANGKGLKVYASQDYSGDITSATWEELNIEVPNEPTSGFGTLKNAGKINVSCLNGNVRFAFVYIGSDPGVTTRYHIDNVKVTGQQN